MNIPHNIRRFVLSLLMMVTLMTTLAPAAPVAALDAPPASQLTVTFDPQGQAIGRSANGLSSWMPIGTLPATRFLTVTATELAFNGVLVKEDSIATTSLMFQLAGSGVKQMSIGNGTYVFDFDSMSQVGIVAVWLYPSTKATHLKLVLSTVKNFGGTVGHPTN